MSWNVEKQASEVIPPVYGQVAAINVTTTVVVVDTTSLPRSTVTPGTQPTDNPVGKYIRITATGGDVYYTTGPNFALLNAIPNTAIFSAVNATTGKVTVDNRELDAIPNGSWKDVKIMPGGGATATPAGGNSPCRYVALITASGTAAARLYQSST
jgi:hypothetical protein